MLFSSVVLLLVFHVFFFKQKTAYEMRISDWSSDVCSSDLLGHGHAAEPEDFAQDQRDDVLLLEEVVEVIFAERERLLGDGSFGRQVRTDAVGHFFQDLAEDRKSVV